MKNIVLLSILLLSSILSNAQFQAGTGLGILPSWDLYIGGKFKSSGKVKPVIGIGLSIGLSSGTNGTDYSGIINIGAFQDDKVSSGSEMDNAFYLYGGVSIGRFEFTGRVGLISVYWYQNRHDPTNILSNSGAYHIYYDKSFEGLFGGNVTYFTSNDRKFGICAGYDNFNSVNVGIKYQF